MTSEPEWAINPRGEVMMVITPPLSHAPSDGRLTPRGRLLMSTEDGRSLAFNPDRKVAGAMKRQDSVLVVEVDAPGSVLRTTLVSLSPKPHVHGMGHA